MILIMAWLNHFKTLITEECPRDAISSTARHSNIRLVWDVARSFNIGVDTLEQILDCLIIVVTADEESLKCGLLCISLCTKCHEYAISPNTIFEKAREQKLGLWIERGETAKIEFEVWEELEFILIRVCSIRFSACILGAVAEHVPTEKLHELMMLQAMMMVKAMSRLRWLSSMKSVHAVCSTLIAVSLIVPDNAEALRSARAFLPLVEQCQTDGCKESHVDIALVVLQATHFGETERDVYFCNQILEALTCPKFDHTKVVKAALGNMPLVVDSWDEIEKCLRKRIENYGS